VDAGERKLNAQRAADQKAKESGESTALQQTIQATLRRNPVNEYKQLAGNDGKQDVAMVAAADDEEDNFDVRAGDDMFFTLQLTGGLGGSGLMDNQHNALKKIASMIADNTEILFDSHAILGYLKVLDGKKIPLVLQHYTEILDPEDPERKRKISKKAHCETVRVPALIFKDNVIRVARSLIRKPGKDAFLDVVSPGVCFQISAFSFCQTV
jgi:hypothetical protein